MTSTDQQTAQVAPLTDFSDRLRALAMLGVVSIHCNLPFVYGTSDYAVNQFGKFANGLFFLVSAYLWQYRNGSDRPGRYLLDRTRSLLLPYAVWLGITLVIVTAWFGASANQTFTPQAIFSEVFAHTAMWFIPQLLITLYVVSVAWRRLGPTGSGVLFAAITVFYSINVHTQWIPIRHTTAVLGFAIYAWCGYVLYDHEDRVRAALLRVPVVAYVLSITLTYVLAVYEAVSIRNDDSLRFASVLYTFFSCAALLAVAYRLKIKGRETPRGVSYGIYLVHTVIMLFFTLAGAFLLSDSWQHSYQPPWFINVPARIVLIAVVWTSSRMVVMLGHRLGLGRLVGAPTWR